MAEKTMTGQAKRIHWVLFLLASVALALAWLPVVNGLMIEGGLSSPPVLRHTLLWLAATGLGVGLLYRFSETRGGGAAKRFPLWIPAIAVVTRLMTLPAAGLRLDMNQVPSEIISGVVQAYLCSGLAILPLVFGHVSALRMIDERLRRWVLAIKRRQVRHLGIGLVSLLLVGVTEGPRLAEANRIATLERAQRTIGVRLPPSAEVLFRHDRTYEALARGAPELDKAINRTATEIWIRSPDPMELPQVVPIGEQEPLGYERRLRRYIDDRHDLVRILGTSWKQDGRDVQMKIFRTEQADYVCFEVEGPVTG